MPVGASGGGSSARSRRRTCSGPCGSSHPPRRPAVADRVARTLSVDGTVRGLAAVTTGVVEEARLRHGTLPTATAALGRALTAATLLAGTLKADERLSLEFSGNGPIRGILAEANPEGDARGFVFRPRTHLPARAGKLDVGGALLAGLPTQVLEEHPVRFRCRCSRERAVGATLAMGRAELLDVLSHERRAELICEFCAARYVLEENELRTLVRESGNGGV